MNKFRNKKLALYVALIGACNSSQLVFAQAENADAKQLEEVMVTGFRTSLKTAIVAKRENTVMVDSIIAEDIGKFPDNNLAESLQRIPGVNITRTDGQGKKISVRGLSSTFSRTRLNGMEVQATTYGTTDRSVDFNLFASELFSRIDVKKTQEAKLEEGSLGATIELYTARPFDSKEDKFAVNTNVGYNENAEELDPRISGLISIQNDDSTLGFAASVAYSDTHTATFSSNTGRWEANTGSGNDQWANSADLPAEVNDAFHPRFPRYYNDETNFKKLGLTGTFQWQPQDETLVTLDMMYSTQDQYTFAPALTPISMSRNHAGGRIQTTVNPDPNSYTFDAGRNALLRADLQGVDIRSEGVVRDISDIFDQFVLSMEHDFSDTFRISGLVGHADSESKGIQTLAIIEAFESDLAYDYTGDNLEPILTYGDTDLTNPSTYLISEARFNNKKTTFKTDNIVADVEWDMNDTFTLSAGLSYKVYEFDYNDLNKNTNFWEDGGQGTDFRNSLEADGCPLTAADMVVGSNLGSLYTDWKGQTYFLADWAAYANQIGFPDSSTNTTDPCFALSNGSSGRRNVEEATTGAYFQLDFRTELSNSMEFMGNFGIRRAETEVSSTGDIATEATTVDKNYSDTLPSFNLGLWLREDLIVRGSWSKVMTRPDLGNLTPGGSVSGFTLTYRAGNPGLDPYRADATDLSVEWYITDEALLSVAWFAKKIQSFPAQDTISVPASELGLPLELLAPAGPDAPFEYTTFVNGDGGDLDGIEIQYQTPFYFGPEWVRDFGVKLNYTNITSLVNHGTVASPNWGRILDQADESYNATLWYESDFGLEARISMTHTGDMATQANSRFDRNSGPRAGIQHGEDITDATDFVDAKVSYRINEALTVSLDMLNLTDESVSTLMGSDGYNLLDTSNQSGRQYYLGVQYKFW